MIDYRHLMRPSTGFEVLVPMGGGSEKSYHPRDHIAPMEGPADFRGSLVPRELPGIMDGGPSGKRVLGGANDLDGDEVQHQIPSVLDVASTQNSLNRGLNPNMIPVAMEASSISFGMFTAQSSQIEPTGVNIAAGLSLVSDAPYSGDVLIASPGEAWVTGLR